MTRLLKAERAQIRRAILADVPQTDYAELIRKRCLELAVASLPPAARRLWENTATRGLLKTKTVYFYRASGSYSIIASASVPGFVGHHDAIKTDLEVVSFVQKLSAQTEAYDQLYTELEVNLAGIGTHEEFAKRWPELVKYLPDGPEAKSANLPATTKLLDDLKAAGLPLDTEAKPG